MTDGKIGIGIGFGIKIPPFFPKKSNNRPQKAISRHFYPKNVKKYIP